MMKIRTTYLVAVLLILAASIIYGIYSQSVLAQSSQSTSTVNLTYLTVQLSYPSQVLPGDVVTVNIQAGAKSSIDSTSLIAQIYYVNGAELQQLTSATISNNYLYAGNSLSKPIQFTIPKDAVRTSLIVVLTEKVQRAYASYYYYYPAYSNYSSPYCYYYPYWGYDCSYSYTYYGYMNYPSYSYETTTDSGIAPLSYIKATTPEFTSLQSQYQTLQSQYQTCQYSVTNVGGIMTMPKTK